MSVAGGLPRAVERAVVHRCEALQIFAKNANQWRGREVPREEIREFRARVTAAGIGTVVSHASYLINLATSLPALRRQSLEAMGDEIDRAEALGLQGVVLHPGCYTSGSEAAGLALIAEALLSPAGTAPRPDDGAARAHGWPGHRLATFDSFGDHRRNERPPRRRLPRYSTCSHPATTCARRKGRLTFSSSAGWSFDRLKAFHLND
jgi:deoxyribonuclease-4